MCDAGTWTGNPCSEQVCVVSDPLGLWGVVRKGQTHRPCLPILMPCLLLSRSWAFGSNSLPIAGSVGMGVARRTQRQFPMPPRALPPGRMGLLSPSGIGGISPRHALTSPSLGGQGRQVSGWCFWSRGGGAWDVCVRVFASAPGLEGRGLLCQLHHSAAWASSPVTDFLSLPMPFAELVVCQPRRQQQHAQPEPQLCAAHPLTPSPLVAPGHSHVPSR